MGMCWSLNCMVAASRQRAPRTPPMCTGTAQLKGAFRAPRRKQEDHALADITGSAEADTASLDVPAWATVSASQAASLSAAAPTCSLPEAGSSQDITGNGAAAPPLCSDTPSSSSLERARAPASPSVSVGDMHAATAAAPCPLAMADAQHGRAGAQHPLMARKPLSEVPGNSAAAHGRHSGGAPQQSDVHVATGDAMTGAGSLRDVLQQAGPEPQQSTGSLRDKLLVRWRLVRHCWAIRLQSCNFRHAKNTALSVCKDNVCNAAAC